MNKKFSTLVASLLFASAFSAYAGTTAPMLAAPTAIETKAVIEKGKALEWDETLTNALPNDATTLAAVGASILPEFTNNARLFVLANDGSTAIIPAANQFVVFDNATSAVGVAAYTPSNEAYWTMQADGELLNNASHTFSVKGYANFDVVPVKAKDKPGYFFVLRVKKSDASFGGYVTYNSAADLDVTTGADAESELVNAALFVSVETAFGAAKTGAELNNELKDGFELAISSAKEGVKVTGAEGFAGKLTAMKYNPDINGDGTNIEGFDKEPGAVPFLLKNKDGKYIYWDADANNDSDKPGAFKLATEKEALNEYPNNAYLFAVHKADNGSKAVQVLVDTDKRLYINNTNNEGRLTAFDEAGIVSSANWAVTSLSGSNKVNLLRFLTGQFVKVNYVANGEEATTDKKNEYKVNGVLAIHENGNSDDFVKAASLVAEAPESQWAVTSPDQGVTIILTNREKPSVKLSIRDLRYTDKTDVYEVVLAASTGLKAENKITITAVAKTEKTDGFMTATENELRNTTYYLGQSRKNADKDIPAYLAENHNMSHKIGATVDRDLATKWNLAFKKKTGAKEAFRTQIDSVLIVSTLNKWNATTKSIVESKDTLVILPYTFQNRENNEFVMKNEYHGMNYYICDKDNNNATDNGDAQKFALKKKADNTYNYVKLATDNQYEEKDGSIKLNGNKSYFTLDVQKLYLGNSSGSGSLEDMDIYAKDNNSLMLVERAKATEYHLVNGDVKACRDTVQLYREDNKNQVLYEKRDDKSVVVKPNGLDTLSFLNIDNVFDPQFNLNPALFVDTAYVNRTVDGVANTCYQYLLAVNVNDSIKTYCPDDMIHNDPAWIAEHGVCPHAEKTPIVKGRFLVNLIDTANIYGATHLHKNPYVNDNEAGEKQAKLAFVPGMHIKDTLFLYTNDDTIKVELFKPDFNIAKFAFRYEDSQKGQSFKIQTLWKEYAPEVADDKLETSQEGYLKWINGTVVVENGYKKGDFFKIEENFKGDPVANENAPEVSAISVVATNGAVIIKGAAGKKVSISNVLGQTVANTVISSDNATISAPAGVVIVAVEGETAVKAIVK